MPCTCSPQSPNTLTLPRIRMCVRVQLRAHLNGFKRCIEDAAVEDILAQMAKGAAGAAEGTGTDLSLDDQGRLAAVEQLMEKVNLKEKLAERVAVAEERMRELRAQLAWRTEALVKAGKQHSLLTAVDTGARSPVKHRPEVTEAVQRTLELRRSVLSVSQELEATEREFIVASGDMEMAELEISASLRKQGAATGSSSGGNAVGADDTARTTDTAATAEEEEDTDIFSLSAVLAGEAVVVRRDHESAAAYRRRLERRLAALSRLEVQMQMEVESSTDALRVTRDELRDVEVLRLRLELQVQHLQAMLDSDSEEDDAAGGGGDPAGTPAGTPTAFRGSGMTPIPEVGGGSDELGLDVGAGHSATTPTALAGYPSVPSRTDAVLTGMTGVSGVSDVYQPSSAFNPSPTAHATARIDTGSGTGTGTDASTHALLLGFEDILAQGLAEDALLTGPVTGLKPPKLSSSAAAAATSASARIRPPADLNRKLAFGAGADDDDVLATAVLGPKARRRKEEAGGGGGSGSGSGGGGGSGWKQPETPSFIATTSQGAVAITIDTSSPSRVSERLRVLVDSLAKLQLRIDATQPGPGPQTDTDAMERSALAALLQAQQMELTVLLRDVHAQQSGRTASAAATTAATTNSSSSSSSSSSKARDPSRSNRAGKLQRCDASPTRAQEVQGQGDRGNNAVVIFKTPALGSNVSEPSPSPYGNRC